MTGEWWVNVLKRIHRQYANGNDIIIPLSRNEKNTETKIMRK